VLADVSFRPAPRAFGKVVHDGLRGANGLIGAIAMVLGQLVDEVVRPRRGTYAATLAT
jgi:hypothetical protein